jgi:hypothetical protein
MMVNKMVKLFILLFWAKTLHAFLLLCVPISKHDEKGFLLNLDWQGIALLLDF